MPTYSDTATDLIINRLTKTQFENATGLDPAQSYEVDPEFVGGKLLQTSATGDIVESTIDPSDVEQKGTITALSATDSITLADNTLYKGGTQTALTVTVPSSGMDVDFVSQITFVSGSTPTTFTESAGDIVWNPRGDDITEGVFLPVANKAYTIIIGYNGVQFTGITEGLDYAS